MSDLSVENVFAKRAKELKRQDNPTVENVFTQRAKELKEADSGTLSLKAKEPQTKTSLLEDLWQGAKRSSAATAFTAAPEEKNPTFGGRLAETAGEMAGDVPAMAAGGVGGALLGAGIGSLFGPIGTAAGAYLGGSAGTLAAPEAVKSIGREVRKGSDLSEAAKNIGYDTGKSAVIGGVMGAAGKAAQPFLKSVGGKVGEKILSTALGRGATTAAGELAGMTAGQKFVGEDPSLEGLATNALLLGGAKGAGAISGAIKSKLPGFKQMYDINKILDVPPRTKEAFDKVKDYVGDREAKIVESHFNWRDKLAETEKKAKFTPQEHEDMMYYRQKTGNPKGESYETIAKRMPEHARDFVDNVIDPHLKESLKVWNDNPLTKDITPREGLEDIYLPGLYEGSPEEIRKAFSKVNKKFSTKNPFSNAKEFLTYIDAFKEAGLKPRFKTLPELMEAYDKTMIKTMANVEFANDLHKLEDETGKKIIVRSTNEAEYNAAKDAGFVPFNDTFLRRAVVGTKNGKPKWGNTEGPALVDPEYAPALQGVFNKNAYRPDYKVLQYYDAASDYLRGAHVHLPFLEKIANRPYGAMLNPFHAVALTEHAIAALGPNLNSYMKEGRRLRNTKEFAVDAARSGLKLGTSDIQKPGKSWLFNELQPNYKAMTWDKFTQDAINKRINEGKPPSTSEIKEIKRGMADLTNNLYGGQNWETMNWFNDKDNMKVLRRWVGYPDWSVSALKNAQAGFKGGPVGDAARKTWLKYGLMYAGTRSLMNAFNSSIVQTDPDKKVSGVRLDPQKFIDNLQLIGKPGQRAVFGLPDVPVKIGGYDFNPGRDAEGHKLFAHFGKSALEIGHYFEKPISSLFNKSNPVFQAIVKQVMGATPNSDSGPFLVQGKYEGRHQKPWGAPQTGYDEAVARGRTLASEVLPFSVRGMLPESVTTEKPKGFGSYLATGLGAIPISKGLTPYKSESYFKKAIKAGDERQVEQLKKTLLDNGYTEKQINETVTMMRNVVHPKPKKPKK